MKRTPVAEAGAAAAGGCCWRRRPLAGAAELSREEYVARVEPICKTNVTANKRIFKGAKGEVKAGKLKQASKHFFRAATAFAKTINQIEAAPQPSPTKPSSASGWVTCAARRT